MTTFRSNVCLAYAPFALLAACGSSPAVAPPPALTLEKQAERMQKCMSQVENWRVKGLWIHGGVEPAVNRDKWSSASDSDRQSIADVAACISSAGKFEPREVQIVSEGFKVPIVKLRSDNRLFEEDFR